MVGTPTVGRRLAPPLPTGGQDGFMFHAKSPLQATHPAATKPVRLLLNRAAWLFRRRRSSGSRSRSPSRQHSAFHSFIVTEGRLAGCGSGLALLVRVSVRGG